MSSPCGPGEARCWATLFHPSTPLPPQITYCPHHKAGPAAVAALKKFVQRCDAGEVRSRVTQAEFREILESAGEQP